MRNHKTFNNLILENETKRTKEIYIVLTQTSTLPSRAIRLYTHEPYAHASIAFDEELMEMYSFARRGIYNPFNAGFIREYIDKGVFGRFESTDCRIYSLRITVQQYNELRRVIEVFNENRHSYSYNYLGLIAAAFNIPIRSKQR